MDAHGITQAQGPPDARAARFLARLAVARPLVLDGATGTELERRGVRCDLPLWSAHALLEATGVLEAIHRDYHRAGAEALVANTFRTHRRSLERAGLGARSGELTRTAVAIARAALDGDEGAFVLGSQAPLEDCYRPDLVPGPTELAREHAAHARHLAEAGVDAILVETVNTTREALAAATAALATGLPVWVSFVCDDRARLLSGEPLERAVTDLARAGVHAVGVNCLPPRAVPAALAVLGRGGLPFGVRANLGAPGADPTRPRSDECSPSEFAAHALGWIEGGARIVGGCCGTRPEHVRAVAVAVASHERIPSDR